MSKITNDGLTRSGTGCFIAVPAATVGFNGLTQSAEYKLTIFDKYVAISKAAQDERGIER